MPNELQHSRNLAFHRQGGRCYYCGVTMSPPSASGCDRLTCTAEHLLPRSEGGDDKPDNIVAACYHCNQTRHRRKRPPRHDRYLLYVQRRVRAGRWHPWWVFHRGLIAAPQSAGGHPKRRRRSRLETPRRPCACHSARSELRTGISERIRMPAELRTRCR